MIFSKKLQAERKRTGLTQAEMAGRLGIAPRTYEAWERAESEPKDIVKAAYVAAAEQIESEQQEAAQ